MATIRVTLYCQWLPHMALWSLKMLFKEAGATFWKPKISLFLPTRLGILIQSFLGFSEIFELELVLCTFLGIYLTECSSEEKVEVKFDSRSSCLDWPCSPMWKKTHTCLIFSLVCFTQIHAVLIQNTLRNEHRPFPNAIFDIFLLK